ncbi:MAG: hypothetical protein ACLUG3_04680 [Bacilli bacterium]
MKKLDIICIIIGVICFLLAGYIVYSKFFKEKEVNFNKKEEIKLLDDKLAKIGTPLGWLIITDGIDHQNEDGTKYNISYGTNLLKEYSNRQLFTMEYILSTKNENDKFILLSGFDNNKIEGEPTDDYTLAYLDYDTFNKYYKDLFGEDFDLNKQDKGSTTYDKEYVYYRNRRAGSNNVYVPIIKAISVEYKNNKYIADIEVTYSTRASELIGVPKSNGTITYTKNIDNNILLEDFIINK